MADTYFNLHQFVGPIPKSDLGKTNFLDSSAGKINNNLFRHYNDYDELKDLLRKGKKDEAKSCIQKGFPLDKDCADDTYDGTPLHLAISLEYTDIVKLLLEKGACVDSKNDSADTPLILAAIVGNGQIIDMILSKTKPKNHSNYEDLSHLHIACMRNNVDLVQKFLASGVNINKCVKKKSMFWPGFTPLHFAVEFKSIETAKYLINNGADITIQDSRGLTPLHLAFRKRNRLLTDLLLSQQYYYASNPVDADGLSHFHIACAFNKKEIVDDFLHKNVDINHIIPRLCTWSGYDGYKFAIRNVCIDVLEYLLKCDAKSVKRDGTCIITYAFDTMNIKIVNSVIPSIEKAIVECQSLLVNSLVEKKANFSALDKRNSMAKCCDIERFSVSEYSELHIAVLQKNLDKVKAILDTHHHSIITVRDAQGKTPVHLAFETDQKEIVEQLLTLHSELDGNPSDNDNLSHFHISCATNNVEVMDNFIKKGADINMPIDKDALVWAGNTPLHLAIIHCHVEASELLLTNGANFTLKNAIGLSSYELAIPHLHDEFIVEERYKFFQQWQWVIQILLANEERKVHNFDNRGVTLLHAASANRDIDIINRYMSADTINKVPDENLTCWSGFTPLHFAAFYDCQDAMKVLLNNGADPAIQNSHKCTAAHYLCEGAIDDRMLLIPEVLYNNEGISNFHIACRCGNLKGVQHFLKLGVDLHERLRHRSMIGKYGSGGETPLHLAAEAEQPEVVKLLLEHGVNVNARNCYFNTPLHLSRNKEVLQVLLDHGADADALNSEFCTALEMAIYNCPEQNFMTAIIETGWDINNSEKINLKEKLEPSNYEDFARNIERLTVLGFNVSEEIRDIYNSIIKDDFVIRFVAFSYKEDCAKELNLMKEMEVDSRTTLYDVLFKSSREMVKYSKNETLQKIKESEQDFKKKYPIYGYLVILQLKKGTKTANLLEEGKKSLSLLMNRWMGDLVLENILQFMNDHEITFLNYASSGQNIFQ